MPIFYFYIKNVIMVMIKADIVGGKVEDKKSVGRPKTSISQEQFEKLCALQCTLQEIASFFDCCDDTINNWCKKTYNDNFSGVYKNKSSDGKISLRRFQFKLAEKNPSMAIWLGKQWLGQRDTIDASAETTARITIVNSLPDGDEDERND